MNLFNDYQTYYKQIESRLEAAAVDDYSRQKLRDNRVTHWLHFAKHTVVRFEFTRIGQLIGSPHRRVRHGNSGTREGTIDLDRIPKDKHPKGPRMSKRKIIRYFDRHDHGRRGVHFTAGTLLPRLLGGMTKRTNTPPTHPSWWHRGRYRRCAVSH